MTAYAFRITKKDQYGVFSGNVISNDFPDVSVRIYIGRKEAADYLNVHDLCVLNYDINADKVYSVTITWIKYDNVQAILKDFEQYPDRIAKYCLDLGDNTFISFTSGGELECTSTIDTLSYAIVTAIEKEGKFYWLHIVRTGENYLENKCFMAHGLQMMGKTQYANRKMFKVGEIVTTYLARYPEGNSQLVCFAPERVTDVDNLRNAIKDFKCCTRECRSRRHCNHLDLLNDVWHDNGTRKIQVREKMARTPGASS